MRDRDPTVCRNEARQDTLLPSVAVQPPPIWDQADLRKSLAIASKAFRFQLRTMEEASLAAAVLAQRYPHPDTAEMGIWELLANAIEHGNLGISYEEKSMFLTNNVMDDEVERRMDLPVFRERLVSVSFEETADQFNLRIRDEGSGFSFAQYRKGMASVRKPHGRGIAIARDLAFDRLTYRGCGNEVVAICYKEPPCAAGPSALSD